MTFGALARRGRHRWSAVDDGGEERVVRMPREAVELRALRAFRREELSHVIHISQI